MIIQTTKINRDLIAQKLAKKQTENEKYLDDTLLNNGVSAGTPFYMTINIDKHC